MHFTVLANPAEILTDASRHTILALGMTIQRAQFVPVFGVGQSYAKTTSRFPVPFYFRQSSAGLCSSQ